MLKCRQVKFSRVFANIFGVVTFLVITCYILASAYAATTDPKDVLQNKCASCHSDSVVRSYKGLSVNQWKSVIARMQVRGLKISDQDKSLLAGYLSNNYK